MSAGAEHELLMGRHVDSVLPAGPNLQRSLLRVAHRARGNERREAKRSNERRS